MPVTEPRKTSNQYCVRNGAGGIVLEFWCNTTIGKPTLWPLVTLQFYEWETRGRGWWAWPHPVDLEPPFRPFYQYMPQRNIVDDGREHTLWSLAVDWFKGRRAPANAQPDEPPEEPWPAASDWVDGPPKTVDLQVTLPPEYTVSNALSQQFLLNLSACTGPVSFELFATGEAAKVLLGVRERDVGYVKGLLQSHFAEAVIDVLEPTSSRQWFLREDETVVVDFGLSNEFCRPLQTIQRFDSDPLIDCFAALDDVLLGELAMLQVLFQPVRHPWAESVFRAVTAADGKSSFFADAPDMVRQVREKLASPLFAATLRVTAHSHSEARSWQIVKAVAGFFRQYEDPYSNELVPLTDEDYPFQHRAHDLVHRTSCRSGMLLNADELVSLVHLPSASVKSKKLVRLIKKTQPAPEAVTGNELVLGENLHQGRECEVSLSVQQPMQHMHLIGASGTGKSTLLLNMIVQDMEHGHGLAGPRRGLPASVDKLG